MTLLRLLRKVSGPYRWQIIFVIFLVIVQTVANLYLPNLNANIINDGVVKGDIGYIWRTGILMLVIACGVGGVAITAVYWASRTAMGIGRDLRSRVFRQVQLFSAPEMSHFGTASLITRNTNDVGQIQLFAQIALSMMVMAPIMSVGGVIMAIHENVDLSALLLIVVPLLTAIITATVIAVVPQFQAMQGRIDRINQLLLEQITGVRVIRAFIRSNDEEERFDVANRSLTGTALRVNRIFSVGMPSLMLVMNFSSVAVIWFGGHLVLVGSMPIGNLTAFLSYIMQILFSVMIAMMMIMLLPRAMASARRIDEVLSTVPSITSPDSPVTPEVSVATRLGGADVVGHKQAISFSHVSFGYPGSSEPVLHDVTLHLAPKTTTAIIGGTGSGKTTLVSLVPRQFDVSHGDVSVNGVDVRHLELEDLWKQMALVPQRSYLFAGTVRDNLRYGDPDASDEALFEALDIAQASGFVRAMDGGLDAGIDQGGTNVSGGQRQRLCIARALVRRPSIYLFDDCFSALDAATDSRVRAGIAASVGDACVVIVAQRVSTVMHATNIVVLDDGAVVGYGPHTELMTTCPQYREIVDSQMRGETS